MSWVNDGAKPIGGAALFYPTAQETAAQTVTPPFATNHRHERLRAIPDDQRPTFEWPSDDHRRWLR